MKSTQKQAAKDMFFGTSKTRKEIADELNVTEKTLYLWIKKEAWDEHKKAAHAAPAIIVDNLCYMLVELQNYISERPMGHRFPSAQEADTMRKLINSITKMKEYSSVGSNMQMMADFTSYISADQQFCDQLQAYAEKYFTARKANPRYNNHFGFEAEEPVATGQELDSITEDMAAGYSAQEIMFDDKTGDIIEQVVECPSVTISEPEIITHPQPVINKASAGESLGRKGFQGTAIVRNFPRPVYEPEKTGNFPFSGNKDLSHVIPVEKKAGNSEAAV